MSERENVSADYHDGFMAHSKQVEPEFKKMEITISEMEAELKEMQSRASRAVADYNRWVLPNYGAVDGMDELAELLEGKQ